MGKMIKSFGWVIIIPLLALLLFLIVKEDAGYILVTGTFPIIGKQAFHLTIIGGLIAGAISTFCIYVFIRIIITLIKLPRIFRGLSLNRRARTADKQFSQAELALLENKPAVAEDLFLTAAKGSKSPNLCYVGAARAAQISGNIENRNRYLREIDMSKSKHDLELAEIQRAEILIEAGEFNKSEELLKNLLERRKNNYAVLLLALSLQRQGKNEALFRLLPDLQKALPRLTPNENVTKYTHAVYKSLFEYASQISKDSDQLRLVWGRLPRFLRQDQDLLIAYANRLLDVGDTKRAETLLRKEINRTHNEMLIMAYAHLYRGDHAKLLHHTKKFAESEPESAITQYTLAHMLFRNKQYEEAKPHIQRTLELDPHFAKAYRLLGEIKLMENDDKGALIAFKEAMAIAIDERPKDIKVVDGDLLIERTEKLNHQDDEAIEDGEISETIEASKNQASNDTNEANEASQMGNNYDPRRHL